MILCISAFENHAQTSASQTRGERLKERGKNRVIRTSLVAQWLRIRLQGTRVRSLVREDATCSGATKPVRHNYGACALEPASHNY